jgi:hypothetical protein
MKRKGRCDGYRSAKTYVLREQRLILLIAGDLVMVFRCRWL